jgi:hypothetical protein
MDFTTLNKEKEAIVREDNLLRQHLIWKTGFTVAEVDAVLHYVISNRIEKKYGLVLPNNFKKDTLLCLQVMNRFAKEKHIRFEDAQSVLTEWALII